jgi:hypothetical protein
MDYVTQFATLCPFGEGIHLNRFGAAISSWDRREHDFSYLERLRRAWPNRMVFFNA